MATIVTRSGKGSPLTHAEVDSNFTNLNTDKLELSGGTMTGNLSFGDNDKAIFGAGSDLQIYHDGTNSYIADEGTGELRLEASSRIRMIGNNGETLAVFNEDGAVSLRYDGSAKLSTTSTGIDVSGNTQSDTVTIGVSSVAGSEKLRVNGTVLTLGGSVSAPAIGIGDVNTGVYAPTAGQLGWTVNGTQRLFLDGTGIDVTGTVTADDITLSDADAPTITMTDTTNNVSTVIKSGNLVGWAGTISDHTFQIRHNSNTIVDVTSTGIDVTGTVTADGLTVDGNIIQTGGDEIQNSGTLRLNGDYDASGAGNVEIQTKGIIRQLVGNTGDISFYDDQGSSQSFFWDASAESLGIGTTSPSANLTVGSPNASAVSFVSNPVASFGGGIAFDAGSGNDVQLINYRTSNMQFGNGGSVDMTLDSSGNVGIGVVPETATSTYKALELGYSTAILARTSANQSYFANNVYHDSSWKYKTTDPAALYQQVDDQHVFFNAASGTADTTVSLSEVARIDSSGNVAIGRTNVNSFDVVGHGLRSDGVASHTADSQAVAYINRETNDGDLVVFRKDNSTVGSIGTAGGDLYISTAQTTTDYSLFFANDDLRIRNSSGTLNLDGDVSLGASNARFDDLYLSGKITNDGTGGIQVDTSGNVLVGKSSQADGATAGHELLSDGRFYHTKSGDHVGRLNRLSTDGDILRFAKDGSTVGSIRVRSNAVTIGNGDTGLRFDAGADTIYPEGDGTFRDNAIDIGGSSVRFDDIYATNGTIQTSDRNEKQDIAELSDAEQRVAVAAKGLLRKFRWRDAVEEKGDEARTHFGIIAQDLQAAFAAEGLDAGDYAMFIHSTWTDEETGEERSRMGVRYSELLAFIIAAI